MYTWRNLNKKKILIVTAIIIAIIVMIVVIVKNSKKTVEATSQPENIEVAEIGKENISSDIWKIETKKDNDKNNGNNGNKEEQNKSVIYLTFDDGPSLDITPKILDILKKENVQATFFVLNYSKDKEELIKREVKEGHSVGLHGYSHDYKEIYKSEEIYMKNLTDLQAKIEQTAGIKTTITRFPGGSSNTVSRFNKNIMTKLTKRVEKEGFKYYDWNVDSDDAGSAKNKKQVYKNVTTGLEKDRSNVVLMHDFENNTKTLDALRNIIKFGKKNGYTFKAITADSDLVVHHNVQN